MSATTLEMAEAIVGLLEGAGLSASLGESSGTVNPPHVVVWASSGFALPTDLGHVIGDIELSFQLTAIGATPEQAQWAADKARVAVNRVIVSDIDGDAFWPIWAEQASQPVRRDDQVQPPMFVATSRWVLRSTPA